MKNITIKPFAKFPLTFVVSLVFLLAVFCIEGFARERLIIKVKPSPLAQSSSFSNLLDSLEFNKRIISEPVFSPGTGNSLSQGDDDFGRELYQTVTILDMDQVDIIRNLLEGQDLIEWVEPDMPIELFEVPDDPLFNQQWYHQNTGQSYPGIDRYPGSNNDTLRMKTGLAGADIGTPEARDKEGNTVKPLIVIIDTGLDKDHPDVVDNLWHNPLEIPDNGIDDDRNGFIDDYEGWDFSGDTIQFFNLSGDNDATDQHGHGTHVAGIAAAVSDNGMGIAGVASNPDLLGLKIFPNAFTSVGMRAIMYATDMGADVINMSWGNFYPSRGLEEVLQYALERNVVLVAAIGNFGDSTEAFPAAFDETITVGASNSLDQVTYFSSYGSWIDLVAPGLDILSLRADSLDMYGEQGEPDVRIIDEMYYLSDGSSMSAPMVAGAAAEILSYSPGISPDSVRQILNSSATDIVDPFGLNENYPGFDVFSGHGRLDLAAALDLVEGRLAKISRPYQGQLVVEAVDIGGTAFSEFGESYTLTIAPLDNLDDIDIISSGSADILNNDLGSYNGWGEDGLYRLVLSVGQNQYIQEIYYASQPVIEISSPMDGDTISGVLGFRGTVAAPDFRRCVVTMYPELNPSNVDTVIVNTGFVADSLIGEFSVGQVNEGRYIFTVILETDNNAYSEQISLFVSNGFVPGFPVPARGIVNYAPAVYDVDGNGYDEVVITSRTGVSVYNHLGSYVPGRWKWADSLDADGPPAVYDINNDGYGEIGFVTKRGIHLMTHDGYDMPGFPKTVPVRRGQNGFPTVYFADMDNDGYEEIIYASMDGTVYVYRYDGSSYFASLDGFFAEVPGFMIEHVPTVFVEDFNRDGQKEMIVVMANTVSIFNTHNGIEPDWVDKSLIAELRMISGACMADFDGDSLLELGVVGRQNETELIFCAIMEPDGTMLEGFPKYFDRFNFLINYPAAADLDFDGQAELLFTISSFDFAEIWVVRSNASTWGRSGAVEDEFLATFSGTSGPPMVADISGDGSFDIIARQGNFFPGSFSEKIHAFDLDGVPLEGWPLFTLTIPVHVFYRLHMPVIADFGVGDERGMADLAVTADDSSLYAWRMPVPYDSSLLGWTQWAYDSRNSGILPPTFDMDPPSPTDSTVTPPQPASFVLEQNFPNPFNAETHIRFRLMRTSDVNLSVYNLLGQKIRTVISKDLSPGEHVVVWDGRNDDGDDVSSGVYFYRLKTIDGSISRKMILLK